MNTPSPLYWSVVYHMTETRVPDYLVYLYNTSDEAINDIVERQKSIGLELSKEAMKTMVHFLLEEECPVRLDGDTMVSLSRVKAPISIKDQIEERANEIWRETGRSDEFLNWIQAEEEILSRRTVIESSN